LYPILLLIHSYWRWIVLLTAVLALIVSISGLRGRRPFAPWGRKAGLIYVTALDMQLLLGLALYAVSPVVQTAWGNIAAAMKDHNQRFFAIEHLLVMVIAIALAHVGSVRAKKAADDAIKYRRMLVWYGASLVLILGGMPWWRPLFQPLTG
jgi:hypothetical protein